jgi:hypothetical protein
MALQPKPRAAEAPRHARAVGVIMALYLAVTARHLAFACVALPTGLAVGLLVILNRAANRKPAILAEEGARKIDDAAQAWAGGSWASI